MRLEVLTSQAEPFRAEKDGKAKQKHNGPDAEILLAVPLVQLSLPRFFLLLILHYRAFVMVPFSWNRLQKSPLTFDRLASKLGLPD